jgi:erythronate-4-phosphate dehydrogenase
MKTKLKVVADNKIPFLKGVLEPFAEVKYLAPSEINSESIKGTDALLIRTRTKCDAKLLDGSDVKFIATATIGFDHIDTQYCDQKNIKWVSAPGCNSSSVMQYISSVFVTIAKKKKLEFNKLTVGIVGVGNVGKKIEKAARAMGINVLLNDPPRMRAEGKNGFVELNELIDKSNIITFHVPLIKEGIDKTYHLADESFFEKLNTDKIIFNSSRGPVVKTEALKNAIKSKKISAAVLDVWENEPEIDKELLELVDIATPHIAGYSADGKANGTAICIKEINSFFDLGINKDWYPEEIPFPPNSSEVLIDCKGKSNQEIISEAVLSTYNVLNDDNNLRGSVDTFEKQRGCYPVRREFPFYKIKLLNDNQRIAESLLALGFSIL